MRTNSLLYKILRKIVYDAGYMAGVIVAMLYVLVCKMKEMLGLK